MTSEEIIKGNEVLAAFMGYPIKTWICDPLGLFDHTTYDEYFIYSNIKPIMESYKDFDGREWSNIFEKYDQPEEFSFIMHINYHEDYRLLMNVWVKFKDLDIKGVNSPYFESFRDGIGLYIAYEPIEKTFELLVTAIEWYNGLKDKQDGANK